MTEERKSQINRILGILVLILPFFILISILAENLILFIIYFMIILSIIGIFGGKWLWKELSSSEVFKSGIPIYIKIFGCIAIAAFCIFIGIGCSLFFGSEFTLIRFIVYQGTLLMLFVAFYNIGYLISIWKPVKITQSEQSKFQIKWKVVELVIICFGIYLVGCSFIYYLFNWEYDLTLLYLILGGFGFSLGWLFWEHLKETKILSGKLLKDLKLVSVLFEIPVLIIMIMGITSNYLHDVIFDKIVLLSFLLLFYLMAAYFIGLMLEVIKK